MLVAGASIFIIITIFMKVISSSEIHMKHVAFWDVILFSLIKVHKYFRASCCLHPTCPDNRGSRTSEMVVLCPRLLGIISQMTIFSLVTSVRLCEPQMSLKSCLCCGLLGWATMSFCVFDNNFWRNVASSFSLHSGQGTTSLLTPSVVCPEMFRGFNSCLYCSIPEVFRAAFSAHYGHARNIPGPILFMLK